MITLKEGNFFDYIADIRINTVNCVGVMGAGVALQFKNKYPKMYLEYKDLCNKKEILPGKLHVWKSNDIFNQTTIINFPTKNHWRAPSEYQYIESGLTELRNYLSLIEPKTITLPALGCGHGGLNWEIVKLMILDKLRDIDHNILLFKPESSTNIQLNSLDELAKRNITHIESNNLHFPNKLKDNTSKSLFYTGNINLLNGQTKVLNIISSSKATEREKGVLYEILGELKHYHNQDLAIFIRCDNSYEFDIAKFSLENEIKVIINPSKGLLKFKIRSDILQLLDKNNYLIFSSIKNQNDNWNTVNFFSNFKDSLAISDLTIYNISDPILIKKNLKINSNFKNVFYVNYFEKDSSILKENENINKIGRTKEGKPNVDKIIHFTKRI